MPRHFALLTVALCIATFASAAYGNDPPPQELPPQLKVCVLSGCNTYHSDKSLPLFIKWLEASYNVRVTLVERKADDDLPGLAALDNCDVAFVFIKRMKLKGDQLERFKKYATGGKPIVAVRTASHAVQTWLEFDKEVLGGNYKSHHPVGPVTKITATPAAKSHPIFGGVELTAANDSLYKNAGHSADIQVLLEGTIPDQPTEPLAWTRDYKGGRIFYTSLGAEDTFELPAFRRMLANALFWTARREPQARLPVRAAGK